MTGRLKRCFALFLFAVMLTACGKKQNDTGLPVYQPLLDLPDDYTPEQAREEGCLVICRNRTPFTEERFPAGVTSISSPGVSAGATVEAGEESWELFYQAVSNNQEACLRMAVFFAEDGYPLYKVYDVLYDGKGYQVMRKESETGLLRTELYKYLVCFQGYYHETEWVLLNDLLATSHDIQRQYAGSLASSTHLLYFGEGW